MLHGQRQFYTLYINRRHLLRNFFKKIKTRFDTSYFESEKSLPKRKYKKTVGPMKNELNGKIMRKFAALRPCSYLTETKKKIKKHKALCVIKRKIEFEDCKLRL